MKVLNKLVGMVTIFMLLVGGVMAGSIEDVDVDASFSFRHGLTIDKISGDIDADTLNGQTSKQIIKPVVKVNNKQNKKITTNKNDIKELGTYVSDNEDSYLSDRKG
ncbi:unnamed protein product, partial [marine sediment metagenome]